MKNIPLLVLSANLVVAVHLQAQSAAFDFEGGIPPEWSAVGFQKSEDKSVKSPRLSPEIIFESKDGVAGSPGALAIDMTKAESDAGWNVIATGAILELDKAIGVSVPSEQSLKITFSARCKDGSTSHLTVGRLFGGSNIEKLALSKDWQEFKIVLRTKEHPITSVLFTPIEMTGKDMRVSGRVEIDDVSVEIVK